MPARRLRISRRRDVAVVDHPVKQITCNQRRNRGYFNMR
jgi:hypothetical protein